MTVFFEPAAGERPAFSSHPFSDDEPPIGAVAAAPWVEVASEIADWVLR
jgi:hypothetical protein